MPGFEDLPPELVQMIFSSLSVRERAVVAQVSTTSRAAVHDIENRIAQATIQNVREGLAVGDAEKRFVKSKLQAINFGSTEFIPPCLAALTPLQRIVLHRALR